MLKKWILGLLAVLVIVVPLAGCGGDTLVGTWYEEEYGEEMVFKSDGSCVNAPVSGITGAKAVSYTVSDRGTIIFKMEWDGTEELEKAESKEECEENRYTYYLSGDTLTIHTGLVFEYKRV